MSERARPDPKRHGRSDPRQAADRPLLITGATGTLGRAFAHQCEAQGHAHRLLTRQEMDLACPTAIAAMLTATEPRAVINAAGFVRVDAAETEAAACIRDNTEAATNLAIACAARRIGLLTFSTDLVFDGTKTTPYVERDATGPLNRYGQSKLAAERSVLTIFPDALVIRTSAFFGPQDPHNFAVAVLRTLRAGRCFAAADDLVVTPTYVPDLVRRSLELLLGGAHGLGHLSSGDPLSWAAFARRIATQAGLPATRIDAVPHARLAMTAPRPRYTALISERGWSLPSLQNALPRWLEALDPRLLQQ